MSASAASALPPAGSPAPSPSPSPAPASPSPAHGATRVRFANALKQAQFILGGGLPAWYLDVPGQVWACVRGHTDADTSLDTRAIWTRPLAFLALACGVATVLLLAYVLLLPARGHKLNYARWHEDPRLRSLIPQVTLTIVLGHVSLLLLLSPVGRGGAPPYGWSPPALLHWASDAMVREQLAPVHFWGWARALVGATCTYLFLFGLVGMLGSIRPQPPEHKLD